MALTEAEKPAEAIPLLRQSVRLRPQGMEARNNLGRALTDLARFAEAEVAYEEALRLDPKNAEAHHNLGNAYKEQGRLEEAMTCYRMALWLDPESASTHYNRSLTLLQAGNYVEGWPAYEWRWRRKKAKLRPFRQPRWDGTPLAGRTILLWCEQGLGDTIQFVRYAALVKQRGGKVILECPGFLIPLLSTCAGIDRLVAEGESLPDFDVQVPLLSLPGLFGTTLETVPAEVPYLSVESARIDRWKKQLSALRGFKIGIVWQGNPHHQWDRHRSVPLERFAPLADVEGVQLISLQKRHGTEQLRQLGERFPVTILEDELDEKGGAFLDTAAVMKNLDLIVTVDTAVAHLAGALGVPVWVALASISDWRWLVGRENTPWYPNLRLFRQTTPGDWNGVFGRMATELERLVARKGNCGSVWLETSTGELLDRITILEIKAERLSDPGRRALVQAELGALRKARDRSMSASVELAALVTALRAVNETLWDVEDRLRQLEKERNFGPRFVELARTVYHKNDERASLKRQVNELLGATFNEPKQYPTYR